MISLPKEKVLDLSRYTLFLLFCLLIIVGCTRTNENAEKKQPFSIEVSVVQLKQERIEITTELPARVSPYLIAEVRPQVSGIIQKRLFTEGSDVKAGDVLYQIDPAPYKASYDNARAALAKAEANLPAIRQKAERLRELVAVKAVSQQEYDDISAALSQTEADIKYWRAAVENAHINLGYTEVKAPISGRIGKSNVTVGALATAFQPMPFATIQQLDPIYVDATQSSANLLKLKKNIAAGKIKGGSNNQTKVRLILEDGTPYSLEGTLKFSDVTVEPSTGSYILRMVFPNPNFTLLPGMYVRTVISEGIADKAILVPQQSVMRDYKGNPYVFIVNSEGKVDHRMINVERTVKDKWLVTSGLKEGDTVIVEGLQKVRPGIAVKTVKHETKNGEASPSEANKPRAKTN
ncbi:MAG: efflux RND transporter periplasmic adaptor subunit [Syntrophorhabdaceae bacterium]|nr:efflux RND transporter periplasmic adaptor subunit [Syntrophorhabdaceae bacterium]